MVQAHDCPIEHRPLPSDNPAQRKPDIRHAREVLGWEPTVQLVSGVVSVWRIFVTLGN
jgi:nucleoside-diphosphate-sugar epimerase